MLKKIGRNDPCWCGSGKKYKDCHLALDEKINSYKLKGWKIPPKKIIKRPDQIDGIRESGLVNIAVLDYVAENHSCRHEYGKTSTASLRRRQRSSVESLHL